MNNAGFSYLQPWLHSKTTNDIVSKCINHLYRKAHVGDAARGQAPVVERTENMGPLRAWRGQEEANREEVQIIPSVNQHVARNAIANSRHARSRNVRALSCDNSFISSKYVGSNGGIANLMANKKLFKSPNLKIYSSRRFGSSASSSSSTVQREKKRPRAPTKLLSNVIRNLNTFGTTQGSSMTKTPDTSMMTPRNQYSESRWEANTTSLINQYKVDTNLMAVNDQLKKRISLSRSTQGSVQNLNDSFEGWNHPPNPRLMRANDFAFGRSNSASTTKLNARPKSARSSQENERKMNRPPMRLQKMHSTGELYKREQKANQESRAQTYYNRSQSVYELRDFQRQHIELKKDMQKELQNAQQNELKKAQQIQIQIQRSQLLNLKKEQENLLQKAQEEKEQKELKEQQKAQQKELQKQLQREQLEKEQQRELKKEREREKQKKMEKRQYERALKRDNLLMEHKIKTEIREKQKEKQTAMQKELQKELEYQQLQAKIREQQKQQYKEQQEEKEREELRAYHNALYKIYKERLLDYHNEFSHSQHDQHHHYCHLHSNEEPKDHHRSKIVSQELFNLNKAASRAKSIAPSKTQLAKPTLTLDSAPKLPRKPVGTTMSKSSVRVPVKMLDDPEESTQYSSTKRYERDQSHEQRHRDAGSRVHTHSHGRGHVRGNNYEHGQDYGHGQNYGNTQSYEQRQSYGYGQIYEQGHNYAQVPSRGQGQSFAQAPARALGQNYAQVPTRGQGQSFAQAPARALGQNSTQVPTRGQGQNYAQVPSRGQGQSFAQAPARAQGQNYAQVPTRGQGQSYAQGHTHGQGRNYGEGQSYGNIYGYGYAQQAPSTSPPKPKMTEPSIRKTSSRSNLRDHGAKPTLKPNDVPKRRSSRTYDDTPNYAFSPDRNMTESSATATVVTNINNAEVPYENQFIANRARQSALNPMKKF